MYSFVADKDTTKKRDMGQIEENKNDRRFIPFSSAVIRLVYAMFERLRKQGCSGLNEEHYFLHHYYYNNFYRCYLY